MAYALEREPEMFLRTQQLFILRRLKKASTPLTYKKTKQKQENENSELKGQKGDHVMNQEILHA